MNRRPKFKFSIGILLIILGLVLAMHGAINYRDILSLPIFLGISILFILIPAEVGRRCSLDNKGVSRDILIILLGFAIAFFIIGVIIPLMQG